MAAENGQEEIGWLRALREALFNPHVVEDQLAEALSEARARQPLPVLWLLGKAQAGKTSIIRALTEEVANDALADHIYPDPRTGAGARS